MYSWKQFAVENIYVVSCLCQIYISKEVRTGNFGRKKIRIRDIYLWEKRKIYSDIKSWEKYIHLAAVSLKCSKNAEFHTTCLTHLFQMLRFLYLSPGIISKPDIFWYFQEYKEAKFGKKWVEVHSFLLDAAFIF